MMNRQRKQSSMFPRSLNDISSNVTLSNDYSSSSSTASPSSSFSLSAITSSSGSILLSVLAWSVTLLLISSCLGVADTKSLTGHSLSKRSLKYLECKGKFNMSIYSSLDRICDDCYFLYRVPEIYVNCISECFTTNAFKGCVDTLLLKKDIPQFKEWIRGIHGADPHSLT